MKIFDESINLVIEIIRAAIEIQCIAIRYQKKEENSFPFIKFSGCNNLFQNNVNCKEKIHINQPDSSYCFCSDVLNNSTFFIDSLNNENSAVTEYGSFWRNFHIADDQTLCSFFSSLALIPIKNLKITKGLFHLGDEAENKFDDAIIKKLESIAQHFAQLIIGLEDFIMTDKTKSYKILIAEDNDDLRLMIAKILNKLGYPTIEASNGLDAFNIITSQKIDLLITDIHMPIMTGNVLIEKIRKRYDLYGPKIIVLSAISHELPEWFADKYQVSTILSKPINNILDLKFALEKALYYS